MVQAITLSNQCIRFQRNKICVRVHCTGNLLYIIAVTDINKVAEDEKKLACIEQTSLDLKTILKVLRSSTSFEELTPTLVNSLIRRIEVHNNDKSSGHCYVKVDIYFTAIGLIDIPTEDEIKGLMAKIKANPQEYRLTA